MNAQATRRGLPAVALWGGLGALAWATVTIFTGGSSAHADDGSHDSLLDGVSSIVSETVSTVEETVTSATSPIVAPAAPVVTDVVQPVVTEVVQPVVTQVVAPAVTHVVKPVQQAAPPVVEQITETVAQVPVVGPPASAIIDTAGDTAEAVVTPVTDLIDGSPVAEIVAPVKDVIAELPIVGGVVDDLGVLPVIDDVVDVATPIVDRVVPIVDTVAPIVDTVAPIVDTVVETTLPPVIGVVTPSRPGSPGSAADSSPQGTAPLGSIPDVVDSSAGGHFAPSRHLIPAASAVPVSQAVASDAGPETGAPASDGEHFPSAPPAGAPSAPTSSAGSSGASSFTPARLGDVGAPALHGVERTPGAPDDVLPTSLVADTDVSPD
ncbi:hypothetical protein AB0N61_12590 [Microbacterium sp. NPDC089320]|uniref:hypothetical protein n=1 Tax=Microbacterium sp. NPDC089320 TaxID=3155182 RepID=UPI0034289E21